LWAWSVKELEKGIFRGERHNRGYVDSDIQELLTRYVEKTKDNTKITVTFALNYGGRDEIIRAINKADSQQLTAESFSLLLDTAGTPDPDMIVRTGGEKRLSGFLLWQSQYSELFFEDWYMPDFTPDTLDGLIEEFAHRQRRFGA
jgi:undecaprenyl diphosphate synthase